MTKIINLTPHDIAVVDDLGGLTTFPKSGIVARVSATVKQVGVIPSKTAGHFQLFKQDLGQVQDLPKQVNDTFLIVSAMVKAASDRADLIAPNSGDAIRNDAGQIIAVKGFIA